MLWYIRGSGNCEGTVFWLSHSKESCVEFSVGRAGCKLNIANDRTVSRKHAILKLQQIEPGSTKYKLLVSDVSTVGTYVNGNKLPTGQANTVQLSEGDVVRFGGMSSNFLVCVESVLAVMSGMSRGERAQAHAVIGAPLNGHCVREWSRHATHLVMSDIQVTAKVLCCLICQKPIVTVQYFKDWAERVKQQKPKPNHADYIPPLSEHTVQMMGGQVNFIDNTATRRTLFASTTFLVFSEKQLNRLRPVVELTGGKVRYCTGWPSDVSDADLVGGRCLILDSQQADAAASSASSAASTSPQSQLDTGISEQIAQTLRRLHVRAISESEVSLAILHNCKANYCIPAAKSLEDGKPAGERPVGKSEEVLAEETQSQEMLLPVATTTDANANVKRKPQDDEDRGGNKRVRGEAEHTAIVSNSVMLNSVSAAEAATSSHSVMKTVGEDVESSCGAKRSSDGEPANSADSKRVDSDNIGQESEDHLAMPPPIEPVAASGRKRRKLLVGDGDEISTPSITVKEESDTSQQPPPDDTCNTAFKSVQADEVSEYNKDATVLEALKLAGFISTMSMKTVAEEESDECNVSAAGLHNISVYSVYDEELPSNLCTVEITPMLRQQPATTQSSAVAAQTTTHQNGSWKNFKKFRKQCVPSLREDYIPIVIGRNDLVENESQPIIMDLQDVELANRIYAQEESETDALFEEIESRLAASKRR